MMEKLAIVQYVDEEQLNDDHLDREMVGMMVSKLLDDGYIGKHVEYKVEEMKHLVSWFVRVQRP